MVSAAGKAGLRQFEKGTGAMRKPLAFGREAVLLLRAHLAERAIMAVGQEHRIIAEALRAARRPHQGPVDTALEVLHMSVGPGDAQYRYEMRTARGGIKCAAGAQLGLDLFHRAREIPVRSRPSGRMNARRTVEGFDHEPG